MERWWRVGEVARATGLTVRTLHHYDEIGLLVPSGRSAGDYRLYDDADLRRLLAIGHLKSLGLSLDEVRAALDEPGFDVAAILDRQIDATRERLAAETDLLARLERLREAGGDGWDDVLAAIALTERLHHADPTVRVRAALESPGRASLDELVEGLRTEPDDAVRETLTWAVVQHGDDATARIVAQLGDPDPAIRRQMAHVASKLHDRSAVPAIATLLDDPDDSVRVKAVFALGQLGGPDAARALLGAFGRGDEDLRDVVAEALARTGEDVVDPLLARLFDDSTTVRAQAADALGLIGDARAVPALAAAVRDPDPDVSLSAVLALAANADDPAARDGLVAAAGSSHARVALVASRLLSGS